MRPLVARILSAVRRVFFWLPSAAPSEERHYESSHDHELIVAVTAPRFFPSWRQLRYASRVLEQKEKRAAAVSLILFLLAGGTASAAFIVQRTVRVPVTGGSVTEAIVGEPKYLNPLDAPADAVDRDLVSLIYSGLFRMEGLEVAPDLAEKYAWSEDGKILTVTLRSDARFHNGDEVTADDVQYTIDAIQDPARESRLAPFFRGLKTVVLNSKTIQLEQERQDYTLLHTLTVGILPSRLWQDIPAANARLADLNVKPVGSGPFRFKSFTRDSRGLIRTFTLERYDRYYGLKPYLKTVVFQFFPDRKLAEDALKADLVGALAFSNIGETQKTESSRWHRIQLELPQETVAFFNLKNKTLSDERVRRALGGVIDRQEIVDAWNGRAVPISRPFPFREASSTIVTLDEGRALLEAAGWTLPEGGDLRIYTPRPKSAPAAKSKTAAPPPQPAAASTSSTELVLTVQISNQLPELAAVAETLKRRWSLLGARVIVEQLEPDIFKRRLTRERTAQIVVTNVLLDAKQDLFTFWWSGQAADRGLNISNLSDRDVDAALEATRSATSSFALGEAQHKLSETILRSTPAAFLVRPSSPYLVSKKIQGVQTRVVVSQPADRFHDLMRWYVKTGWRWR